MKIAFAHMYTLRNPRGIERFIISVANGLAKLGHDVTLITGRCKQPVTKDWIDADVHVREIFHQNWHKLSFVPGFMMEFLTGDYDIVNLAIARGEGYAAGLAHMIKDFRYNIVFQYPLEEHEKHFNAFKKFGTVKHAGELIAASDYIARGVEACFGRPARTVPNGVDPGMFHPDDARRSEVRKMLKIPHDAPVVITVAALQGRKGIDKVLRVVGILKETFPDIRYIICGDGKAKERDTLFGLAASLGIKPNVHFIGNQKDVSGYYNAADLFVFLPEFEGFGIVALEAMASRLPLVVSRGSAFPEILADGGGIMVDPDQPAVIAQNIGTLLGDRDRMALMGREGRAAVEHTYSWDAVAKQFAVIFENQIKK
jgi:glycosyltransferase involved in cell wall biosynthesis